MSSHNVETEAQNHCSTEADGVFDFGSSGIVKAIDVNVSTSTEGRSFGTGTTIGNGVQGWARGALFLLLRTTSQNSSWAFPANNVYVNSGTSTTAVWSSASETPSIDGIRYYTNFEDDFFVDLGYTSTDDGATGTNVFTSLQGGHYSVLTAAADNDYHLMSTQGRIADVNLGYPFWYTAKFKLTEAATDAANWVVGLSDTLTTGFLANDGGGPPASYNGSVFFKLDGDLTIYFEHSKAGVQSTQAMGTFTSGSNVRVDIVYDGLVTVTPYLNGTAGTAVSVTSATAACHGIFGVKAGGGNAETLTMDYHKCVQYWGTSRS